MNVEPTNRNEDSFGRIMAQLAALAEQQQAQEQAYLARCGNVVTTSGTQLPDDPEDPFRCFVVERASQAAGDDMSRGRGHALFAVSGHRWVAGQWLDYAGPATGVWVPDEEGLLAEQRVEATVELMESGVAAALAALREELDALEEQLDFLPDAPATAGERAELGERVTALQAKLVALAKARTALRSRRTRDAMLRDARKHLRLAGDACDAEDTKLNTPAGLLDLGTLALRPGHLPGDFTTRITAADYDSAAEDPRWRELVEGLTRGPDGAPDPDLLRYLRMLLGSMLLGVTNLRLSVLLTGPPRTLKTTFLRLLRAAAGDYVGTMGPEGLAQGNASKQGANTLTPELEAIVGRRGIVVDELEDGFAPNVPLFKALTGSDTVTINPKNRRPYAARTTATFAMATNGDWRMPAGEAAGWARLYVVDLSHARQVPEERADKQASERLAADPAMRRCALRFLVEGARDLLACGGAVTPPARAEAARERMRRESNTLHEPLELEVLRLDPAAETATGELLLALHEYARDTGRAKGWAPTAKQLARDLRALGCAPLQVGGKNERRKGWRGIALGPESPRGRAAEAAARTPEGAL